MERGRRLARQLLWGPQLALIPPINLNAATAAGLSGERIHIASV